MFGIANTIYLLAALGILVPLIIHLWNRKPPQIVEVGSIRWLKGSTTKSVRRLRMDEWPLLLLRSLMLLIFSLLLAGLFRESSSREQEKRGLYLIHAQQLQTMGAAEIDSLKEERRELRILAPGLPSLADSLRWKGRPVNVWAVLRDADREPAFSDSVWVSSPLEQAYFGGERPGLHKRYIFVEEEYPQESRIVFRNAVRQEGEVILQEAVASADKVRFRRDTISAEEWGELRQETGVGAKEPLALKVSILAAEAYARDAEIIRYAVEAAASLDPSRSLLVNTEKDAAGQSDVLVWLDDEAISSQLRAEAALIVAYDTTDHKGEEWLLQDYRNPRQAVHYLSERPLPERVSREKLSRLPLALAKVLQDNRQEELSRYLPMPLEQARPLKAAAAADGPDPEAEQRDLHVYVWLLLFLLFVIERIWVYRS